ncbi:MAG: ATP-dependent zinc protease, partial [Marinicellaceae bacterium]
MKIGWVEWLSLPELKVDLMKAKIDTGARTSALHTFKIEVFKKEGIDWVRFWVHPNQDDYLNEVICECPLKDQRSVTNSGGNTEQRYVIETPVKIADKTWPIEITLTNRDEMKFRMLLG